MFSEDEKRGKLRLIASNDGRDGSVTIHQDTRIYATLLEVNEKVEHPLAAGRHAWIQVARGAVKVNGQSLNQGDGAAITGESMVELTGEAPSEVLLFDLA